MATCIEYLLGARLCSKHFACTWPLIHRDVFQDPQGMSESTDSMEHASTLFFPRHACNLQLLVGISKSVASLGTLGPLLSKTRVAQTHAL